MLGEVCFFFILKIVKDEFIFIFYVVIKYWWNSLFGFNVIYESIGDNIIVIFG